MHIAYNLELYNINILKKSHCNLTRDCPDTSNEL